MIGKRKAQASLFDALGLPHPVPADSFYGRMGHFGYHGYERPRFPRPDRRRPMKTGGRLVLIEGAGHYPQTEMPEKTAPFVLDFLQQV